MISNKPQLTTTPEIYRKRRAALADKLHRPLVIFAGHAPARSYASNPHRFRPACSFLYFGGPHLENSAWLIEPGSDGDSGSTFLRLPPGPDESLWLGPTPSDSEIAAAIGINQERIKDTTMLPELLTGRPAGAVIAPFPDTIAAAQAAKLEKPSDEELLAIIDLRLIKDEYELAAMRSAAQIAVEAHGAAMHAAQAGNTEFDVEAAFVSRLTANGCVPSFSPIITIRGEVLHGASAGRTLAAGNMIIADAGAEEPTGYTSDITRSYPVGGKWSEIQLHLYNTVLTANTKAIDACRPGRRYREIHEIAALAICEGLVQAELLKGDPEELARRGAYALFFPHGVGHLLGLGVHDMEEFGDLAGYAPGRERPTRFGDRFLRLDRDLEPGMVVTIEPGIYLIPTFWERDDLLEPFADVINRGKVDALLRDRFGGIRIEDDIHVTRSEPENLTSSIPKDADEVAKLVAG